MIPLRTNNFEYSTKQPKHIIIHHMYEWLTDFAFFKIDTTKPQVPKYIEYSYKVLKQKETGYHYAVDRINNDFYVFASQPLLTICKYPDIPKIYENAIHIGIIGDYNEDIPMIRMYKVLAYRILVPMTRLFRIPESRILFHKDVSIDKKQTCPGEFMDRSDLITQFRSVKKNRSVTRG